MIDATRTSKHWAYKSLQIPETWDSLEDFVIWYKMSNYPLLPPSDMQVYTTDVSYSTIVFRKDRYQVELYMIAPNMTIQEHSHKFNLQLIFLGGSIQAYRGTRGEIFMPYGQQPSRNTNLNLPHQDSGKLSGVLPQGELHKFYTLQQGALLFNIEMWEPSVHMTSATINYSGTPLGPVHAKTLQKDTKCLNKDCG